MANSTFHLFQLQKIDSRIDLLNKRLGEISAIRNNNAERKILETNLDSIKQSVSLIKKSYKDLEEKVNAKKLKIEQSEASLYGGTITNPKELQDLQKEVQSIKQAISSLEDDQLQNLIEIESVEKQESEFLEELSSLDEKLSKVYSSLANEEKEINTELAKLQNERNASLPQISNEFIDIYSKLRNSKKGIAIASIEDNCCTACGSTLTPSECQNAKSPSAIVNCPSCGRILYAG